MHLQTPDDKKAITASCHASCRGYIQTGVEERQEPMPSQDKENLSDAQAGVISDVRETLPATKPHISTGVMLWGL